MNWPYSSVASSGMLVDVLIGKVDAEQVSGLGLDVAPGRETAAGMIEQAPVATGLPLGIEHIFAQKHLVRRMRSVGLVLVDERCGLIGLLVDIVRRADVPVGSRLIGGPRQHHEIFLAARPHRADRPAGAE